MHGLTQIVKMNSEAQAAEQSGAKTAEEIERHVKLKSALKITLNKIAVKESELQDLYIEQEELKAQLRGFAKIFLDTEKRPLERIGR